MSDVTTPARTRKRRASHKTKPACKTITAVVRASGKTFLEIWPVLAGAPCEDLATARKLSEALGLSVESLVKQRQRIRSGVLDLFVADTLLAKTTVWRILSGRCAVGEKTAVTFERITSVKAIIWQQLPGSGANPIVEYNQKFTASGKRALSDKIAWIQPT